MLDKWPQWLKLVGDTGFGVTILGAIAKVLPPLAALASLIWFGIQIYDRFWGKNKPKVKLDDKT